MHDNPYKSPAPQTHDSFSLNGGAATVTGVTIQKRSPCYLSTPEHVRSFVGRFVYIYTDKGELELTEAGLRFVGKNGIALEIPLDTIASLNVGHYSRWAKPARLNYIAVHQRQGSMDRTVLLTPTQSWATSVWQTNRIVADWLSALQSAGQSHSHA